jgi:hypothetical protein
MENRRRAFVALAAAAVAALTGLSGTAARAQTPPTVRYAPEAGARTLLFENNPEQLVVGYTAPDGVTYSDLADPGLGQKSLLRQSVAPGQYRNFFEHVNYTGRTINFGIQVYNPSSTTTATVTVRGKGFVVGTGGGRPFADAFATPLNTTYTLAPGRSAWIFRSDADYNNQRPINANNFFSGVVDFDVSGTTVFVTDLAYQNFVYLTSWSYMGYITRQPANPNDAPESRVYKGTMTGGTITNLSFTINDSTAIGDLPVQYPRYLNDGTGKYVASSTIVSGTNWYTHELPWRENSSSTAIVVANDMSNIEMPGFGTVYALQPTLGTGSPYNYANLANWGVVYHQKVTITNGGTRSRSFQMRLGTASGGAAPLAYRGSDGLWRYGSLTGGALPYYSNTVPAGTTKAFDAYYVIGGPAVGRIRNSVYVTN